MTDYTDAEPIHPDYPGPPMDPLPEIALPRIQLAGQMAISHAFLHSAEFEKYRSHSLDQMILRIAAMIVAEPQDGWDATLRAEAEVHAHAHVEAVEWESWWQHTKAVHFPTISRWLGRPPRHRIVDHDDYDHAIDTQESKVVIRAVYPSTNIAVPGLGPVRFLMQGEGGWETTPRHRDAIGRPASDRIQVIMNRDDVAALRHNTFILSQMAGLDVDAVSKALDVALFNQEASR